MILLGVDPKLTASAYAIKRDGAPVACGLLKVPKDMRALGARVERQWYELERALYRACGVPRACVAAVEIPRSYPGERSQSTPNDLIDLAAFAALGTLGLRTLLPYPYDWKGRIAKTIHHDRLRRDFPAWIPLVAATGVRGKKPLADLWDAIGIVEWLQERYRT